MDYKTFKEKYESLLEKAKDLKEEESYKLMEVFLKENNLTLEEFNKLVLKWLQEDEQINDELDEIGLFSGGFLLKCLKEDPTINEIDKLEIYEEMTQYPAYEIMTKSEFEQYQKNNFLPEARETYEEYLSRKIKMIKDRIKEIKEEKGLGR